MAVRMTTATVAEVPVVQHIKEEEEATLESVCVLSSLEDGP